MYLEISVSARFVGQSDDNQTPRQSLRKTIRCGPLRFPAPADLSDSVRCLLANGLAELYHQFPVEDIFVQPLETLECREIPEVGKTDGLPVAAGSPLYGCAGRYGALASGSGDSLPHGSGGSKG